MDTHPNIRNQIGARIQELIEQQYPPVSAASVARKAGLTRSGLSGMIHGTYNPTVENLDAVRRALGASWGDFDVPPGKGRQRVGRRFFLSPVSRRLRRNFSLNASR